MGGSGGERAFREMEHLIGKRPAAVLDLKMGEVVKERYKEKVKVFINKIKK